MAFCFGESALAGFVGIARGFIPVRAWGEENAAKAEPSLNQEKKRGNSLQSKLKKPATFSKNMRKIRCRK